MQSVWISVIQQVLVVLLQLVVFAFMLWVHSAMPALQRWLQHHVNEKERQFLSIIGHEAYIFAEQAFSNLHGIDKLDKAMNYALTAVNAKGLSFTSDEIRAAIEQAVAEANQAQGK